MIRFLNGHSFEYMVASGALGFDGKGWLWDKPLIKLGLMDPSLFTVALRTLTRKPRLYPASNLSWIRPWTWLPWSPWSCVRFLRDGGAVNKVGLYNPGIEWWSRYIGPHLNFRKTPLVGSIFGEEQELIEMAAMLNQFDLVGIEVNCSCPNASHGLGVADAVVRGVRAVRRASRHPIIVKVSVDQDYLAIAEGLRDTAEAISLNSVPWKTAFPNDVSPLQRLERKVGGGGGGVSGKPAQMLNWKAVELLSRQGSLPVIGPSVMEFADLDRVRSLGAAAVSFGAIHLRTPWRPTYFVRKERT